MQKFKKMPLLYGAFLLSFALLSSGCQPQRHTSPIADYEGASYNSSGSSYGMSSDESASDREENSGDGMRIQKKWEERTRELVLDAATVAKGTPYVYGGTTLSGFDCSGFVRWAYNAVGVDLPRSAREQSQFGRTINRANLRMGDIVAFRHPKRGYHTGLYVGNGQFIHSPRTRDVVKISSLTDPYFSGTYLGARRPALPDTVDLKQVEKNVIALKAQKKALQTASLSRKRSGEISKAAAKTKSKATKNSKNTSKTSKKATTAPKKNGKSSNAKKTADKSSTDKKVATATSKTTSPKAKTTQKSTAKAPVKTAATSKTKKEPASTASSATKKSSKPAKSKNK